MKKVKLFSILILLCMFLLQGCAKEGETSIKVVVNEDKQRVEVELKANETKNHAWTYFTKNNKLTESATEFQNDIFSETYIQKYGFVIEEREQDTIYFVLYETDNVETGKVYKYDIAYDSNGKINLSEGKESLLENNPDLLEKVKAIQ